MKRLIRWWHLNRQAARLHVPVEDLLRAYERAAGKAAS